MSGQDKKNTEANESIPFTELLGTLPDEQREIIEQSLTIASFMQNSPESSISKKINEEHISTYLKDSGDNMRKSYQAQTQNRILAFGIVLVLSFLVCFIIFVFKEKPDFVEKIIYTSGGAVLGALGGFGFGKSKNG